MLIWLSNCSKNSRIVICSVNSEIYWRNCQIKLFHAIVNWLCVEIKFVALIDRKKFCANILKFLCNRTFFIIYLIICILIKATNVRFLNRRIKALYQFTSEIFFNIFFFNVDNSIECHVSADSRKHCEMTILSLLSFLITIMFFNLFVKTYTSR